MHKYHMVYITVVTGHVVVVGVVENFATNVPPNTQNVQS